MSEIAVFKNGQFSIASEFGEKEWEIMKENYTIGDYLMPCCKSAAIPKTSANGLRFFSHHSDICASAPETKWHLQTKESLIIALHQCSILAKDEVSGGEKSEKWKADVYFEYRNRKIAFEVQHSYQHLRDYFKRQRKYLKSNVECYWILYQPRFLTVTKSIAKYRIKEEFGNSFPKDLKVSSGLGQISLLPIVFSSPDDEQTIRAPMGFSLDIKQWVESVLDKSFSYSMDGWGKNEGK